MWPPEPLAGDGPGQAEEDEADGAGHGGSNEAASSVWCTGPSGVARSQQSWRPRRSLAAVGVHRCGLLRVLVLLVQMFALFFTARLRLDRNGRARQACLESVCQLFGESARTIRGD